MPVTARRSLTRLDFPHRRHGLRKRARASKNPTTGNLLRLKSLVALVQRQIEQRQSNNAVTRANVRESTRARMYRGPLFSPQVAGK